MKIPQKLFQFNQGAAVLVVSGSQEADFYLAESGTINKAGTFQVEREHFSDREDYGRRGSMVFETGSKFEREKNNRQRVFLKDFKVKLTQVVAGKKLSALYLFAPSQVIGALEEALPAALKKKTRGVYEGNFHSEPILKLLEKVGTLA